MRFKLVQKTETKFQIHNERQDVVGSICIDPSEVNDLLRHWQGAVEGRAQSKHKSPVETLVNAFKARKFSSAQRAQVVLRGC